MAVYERVVVGTDGSETAGRAVQKAATLAATLRSKLVIATGYHRPDEDDWGPASQRAERRGSLGAFAFQGASDVAGDAVGIARSTARGVDVSTSVREGDPAEILIEVAAAKDPSLLVVGNKGMMGAARFFGNVPNRISHHALSDLLICRTDIPFDGAVPKKMLIASDGSRTASRALDRGLDIAATLGAEVTVLFVGTSGKGKKVLDDARQRAEQQKVPFTDDLRSGDPAAQIVRAGEDHDLVVVGNKGMTTPGRFIHGSVPNSVSHSVHTDLCIVRTVE